MELLGRFGRAVWGALCAAGRFLGWLLGGLFGRMQWQAPGWLKWTGNKGLAGAHVVKARPWRSALIAFGTMAVLAGGVVVLPAAAKKTEARPARGSACARCAP